MRSKFPQAGNITIGAFYKHTEKYRLSCVIYRLSAYEDKAEYEVGTELQDKAW